MTPSSSPALVLVHGAWHAPEIWTKLIGELPEIDVRNVRLPSSGNVVSQLGDLYADARTVRSAVESVGGPVVVAASSYGGAVVTEALAGVDAVKRLIYINAFQLEIGQSILGACNGVPREWWRVHDTEGYVDVVRGMDIFYNDVNAEDAEQATGALLLQSYASFVQPITQAAWHTIPSSYVIGERDAAIPVGAQEFMAGRAHRTWRLDAGHSPFLSRPAEMAGILREEMANALT
jgi:pimeloyl-ACP methyl ester carboxylesterase